MRIIESYDKKLQLSYVRYELGKPRYTPSECRQLRLTYGQPFRVWLRLEKEQPVEEEVFLGDIPIMLGGGEFIINGAERVVVSQLIRSPGVYFTVEEDRITGRALCMAKLIPNRGAWLEFESSKRDVISVKVDRKRKLPVSSLLRAVGFGTDEELHAEMMADTFVGGSETSTNALSAGVKLLIENPDVWERICADPETTLPVFVFSLIRRGVTPLINAVSVVMLVASLVLVALSLLAERINADSDDGPSVPPPSVG